MHQEDKDMLVPVFKNGEIITDYSWEDIRERAATFV